MRLIDFGPVPDTVPLINPHHVADDFAHGIARLEEAGGECLRVIYCTLNTEPSGEQFRTVVRKIILPYDSRPAIRALFQKFFAERGQRVH